MYNRYVRAAIKKDPLQKVLDLGPPDSGLCTQLKVAVWMIGLTSGLRDPLLTADF